MKPSYEASLRRPPERKASTPTVTVDAEVVMVAAMIEFDVLAGIGMAPSTAVGAKLIWPPTGIL